jgi:hypothetical protein
MIIAMQNDPDPECVGIAQWAFEQLRISFNAVVGQ